MSTTLLLTAGNKNASKIKVGSHVPYRNHFYFRKKEGIILGKKTNYKGIKQFFLELVF